MAWGVQHLAVGAVKSVAYGCWWLLSGLVLRSAAEAPSASVHNVVRSNVQAFIEPIMEAASPYDVAVVGLDITNVLVRQEKLVYAGLVSGIDLQPDTASPYFPQLERCRRGAPAGAVVLMVTISGHADGSPFATRGLVTQIKDK